MSYERLTPQIVEQGINIAVATTKGQETGLKKAHPYWLYNGGANPAFINTQDKDANATLDLLIPAGEYAPFPILTSRTGKLDHISTTGATTIVLIPFSY